MSPKWKVLFGRICIGGAGFNIYVYHFEQELSYRKQIACQLHTQYVEGIYRPNNAVTRQSTLRVTQDHSKRNHWIDHKRLVVVELSDIEYYRDLEMWVRGHSRSLKMILFESLGMVSYSPSVVTMAISLTVYEIFSIKKIAWPWKLVSGCWLLKVIKTGAVR